MAACIGEQQVELSPITESSTVRKDHMGIVRAYAVVLLVALTTASQTVSAQTKESATPILLGQAEGDFTIKDFQFKSGEVFPELRLHYVTLGTPHRNSADSIAQSLS